MPLVGLDGQPLAAPGTPPAQPQTPDEPAPPKRVATAFLVMIAPNGRVSVTDDLGAAIVPSRKPSFDDIIGAAANVQVEIAARKTADMAAATTVQTQLAVQRQLQAQQLSPEEAAALSAAARRG